MAAAGSARQALVEYSSRCNFAGPICLLSQPEPVGLKGAVPYRHSARDGTECGSHKFYTRCQLA